MEENHLKRIIFIISGGPSAKGKDLAKLHQLGYVIGINDAFLHTPCHAIVSMDGGWMMRRYDKVRESGLPTFFSRAHFTKKCGHEPEKLWDGLTLKKTDVHQKGMSLDPEMWYAKHSGGLGLQVAFDMRPKQLYLFGMDHTDIPKAGEFAEHWYGDYEWRPRRTHFRHMSGWIADHANAAKQFTMFGIEVFNVSEISLIKDYKRIKQDDIPYHIGRISKVK